MKVIVNTGFGLKPAGIEIVKNEQRIMYSPMKRDCWAFGANAGDRIEVRLKFAGSPRLTVAICMSGRKRYMLCISRKAV